MKRRAKIVYDILQELYPNPEVPLTHKDPYTLLIAVLLSAQCTDARVNKTTPALFALADTPETMAKLPVETILDIIRPCGLGPTKAKAIRALSQKLIEEHRGAVPDTLEALEKLPGVGHKTASVVVSKAFGKPSFPVDTHIHRCAQRWGLSSGQSVVRTEKDLKGHFPKSSWQKLHLQIIYYARAYCPARNHIKTQCPICTALENIEVL